MKQQMVTQTREQKTVVPQQVNGILQRWATRQVDSDIAPPIVYEVLRSSGRPLDDETRAFMEPRFGHDFSRVRVHTDDKAAESARAVNARAYTVERNLVFGEGEYAPQTTAGRQLLAHELTHVVQQRLGEGSTNQTSLVREPLMTSESHGAVEKEAEAMMKKVGDNARSAVPFRHDHHSMNWEIAPAGRILPYRERRGSVRWKKEEEFKDRQKQPWIETIEIEFNDIKKVSKYWKPSEKDWIPIGTLKAKYHANKAKLSDINVRVVGGYTSLGLTDQSPPGNGTLVHKIEGWGYNDAPLKSYEQLGGGKKEKHYFKDENQSGSMGYAVYINPDSTHGRNKQAIHVGDLDSGSHSCVHVRDTSKMQKINFHSRINKTKVKVSYTMDSAKFKTLCCSRIQYLEGGRANNPCNNQDPKQCP